MKRGARLPGRLLVSNSALPPAWAVQGNCASRPMVYHCVCALRMAQLVIRAAFLPDSEYAPADSQKVRVLRKADGTGFFLTLHGTTGPDLGKIAYRLRLKYRRDNRSQQQNSLVLSKANDRSDEVVILDIVP
jgi:hypothetical protein